MSDLTVAESARFPAELDVVGQVALALAVADVTEPPRAMLPNEFDAFNKLMNFAWYHENLKLYHYELRQWQATEAAAHDNSIARGSFPIHWGLNYWREYTAVARIAVDAAHRVYGLAAMKKADLMSQVEQCETCGDSDCDKPRECVTGDGV